MLEQILANGEERLAVRQAKSVLTLDKLYAWLIKNEPRVAKESLTGKAITYLFNQWDKLIVYCTDGQRLVLKAMKFMPLRLTRMGKKNVMITYKAWQNPS